jgi:hypothetical protein
MRSLRLIAMAAVPVLLLGAMGVSNADEISNNLDASVDAVAEVMPLTVGGADGITQLYVIPLGGDGKPGCNLTGSTSLSLDVTSSNTSVATVSPSSVTFTSCSGTPTLTVTPVSAGTATVSVAQASNTTSGTFNLAPATFEVTVSPPPNTAPQVSVTGVAGGASYNKGSVPSAGCAVTDAEDGNSSFSATLSAVTGLYASDGIGSQTASCSYTDGGGLTAVASETYNIVDPTSPAIGYTLDPASADGTNGWYRSEVSLTWNVSEPESPGSLVKAGCVDQSITADQASTDYTCAASSAGGGADEVAVSIKRDATPPEVAYGGVVSGTTGDNGWYVSDVTVRFDATDETSGVTPASKQATSSGEGATVVVESPEFTDVAGNTATAGGVQSPAFKVDTSDPTAPVFSGGPGAGASYYFGEVPAAPSCSATDAVSGIASCLVSGYSTAVGSHTLTATATDNAGRTQTSTRSYTVLAWSTGGFYAPVDVGGVYNTVKGGSTVPLKFELFAGSSELTSTSAVASFKTTKITCSGAALEDAIEILSTGATSLRYDSTAGQFIQNWKTPTGAGTCYSATMTAADGSALTALFKLK